MADKVYLSGSATVRLRFRKGESLHQVIEEFTVDAEIVGPAKSQATVDYIELGTPLHDTFVDRVYQATYPVKITLRGGNDTEWSKVYKGLRFLIVDAQDDEKVRTRSKIENIVTEDAK